MTLFSGRESGHAKIYRVKRRNNRMDVTVAYLRSSTCTSTCKGYNSAEIHIINNGSTLNTPGGDWHTYYGNQEQSRTSDETTPSIENFFAPVDDRRKSTSHAGRKRKTRSGAIVAIGGTRIRPRITYNIVEENGTHGPENRKRSAKSIADEEMRGEGEIRFIPPAKKRKEGEEDT